MLFDQPSQLRSILALTGVLLLTMPACAGGGGEGGSSPEDVYKRLRTALADEDFSEVVLCMEPEKRPLFSLSFFIGASMVVVLASSMGEVMGEMVGEVTTGLAEGLAEGFGGELSEEERNTMDEQVDSFQAEAAASTESLEAQLQAVLEKHGLGHLTDEDAAFDISGDLNAIANEVFADVDHGAFVGDLLTILNQAGDDQDGGFSSKYPDADLTDVVVTGQRATGSAGETEIEFVEVDGRWYLALDLKLSSG